MKNANTEKPLPDLTRTVTCAILVAVCVLAILSGSVFLLDGVISGATRLDLIFFGAVICAGIVSGAGAIFMSGRATIISRSRE